MTYDKLIITNDTYASITIQQILNGIVSNTPFNVLLKDFSYTDAYGVPRKVEEVASGHVTLLDGKHITIKIKSIEMYVRAIVPADDTLSAKKYNYTKVLCEHEDGLATALYDSYDFTYAWSLTYYSATEQVLSITPRATKSYSLDGYKSTSDIVEIMIKIIGE